MRVIFSGSKDLLTYGLLEEWMTNILSEIQYKYEIEKNSFQILLGSSSGADVLCKRWAIDNLIPTRIFLAEWKNIDPSTADGGVVVVKKDANGNEYNSYAGFNRNTRMVESAFENFPNVICIAFDAGTSDVKDVIKKSKERGIETYQIHCKKKIRLKVWNKD